MVVPRYPDRDDATTGPPQRYAQSWVIRRLVAAGGSRVAVYDVEVDGAPVYVHAKACVIDDVWCAIGSDNLNRRSWTNDSELTCAIVYEALDERMPTDPGGRGDGARRFARETRLALAREHLELDEAGAARLTDPRTAFDAFRAAAGALDAWHERGRIGPRPRGRLRHHEVEPVVGAARCPPHWRIAGSSIPTAGHGACAAAASIDSQGMRRCVSGACEDRGMAFGQQSGPPASARQVQQLAALVERAGHSDFRDARGPLGLTQRQAAGKFTRDEADTLIEQLEAQADAEASADVEPSDTAPAPRAPRPVQRDEKPPVRTTLRTVSSEILAAELQRRGWVVMEP